MNPTTDEPLRLSGEELALMAEMLDSERTKLLNEISHAHHRTYRDELRRRLELVESLIEHCRSV